MNTSQVETIYIITCGLTLYIVSKTVDSISLALSFILPATANFSRSTSTRASSKDSKLVNSSKSVDSELLKSVASE